MERMLLGLLGLGTIVVILKWGRKEDHIVTIAAQITDILMGSWESTSL